MQTYRVKMNNVKSAGRPYDPDATKGIRFFHICSDSIAGALKLAEQQFPGECESVTAKKLADPSLKISEMQEYENYELLSSPGSPNDTIIFRRNCQKINVTLRGRDFSERGTSFWFDMSIFDFLTGITHYANADALTLERLEMLSFEIYSIVIEKHIPAMFNGKMELIENR
ncbi:hypothetical protein [Planomicrobium okeanokoites]|uniref:hypothetical protein n=1 Tax=Planomicrobium okeanokoites TaxID=244 RepID=UPI00249105D1|nr:hypothetical protein [Planomicrobium okeanokoites]